MAVDVGHSLLNFCHSLPGAACTSAQCKATFAVHFKLHKRTRGLAVVTAN